MNLLGAKLYDPAAAVSKATSALLAMTAFDTTNLRVAVTVPAHGMLYFRIMGGAITGATTVPTILIGVLNGATVVARMSPQDFPGTMNAATQSCPIYAEFVATGLTPGAMNLDLAYGVEVIVAATNIKYGGPNNTTTNDAWGGISFQVWDPQPIPTAAAGAAGGLFIAGTNAATSITTGLTAHLIGTVDTLTTYTGNTVQTGDAFAIVNNATSGNVALNADTEEMIATLGAAGAGLTAIPTIATVTTLTNLPSIPANWLTAAGINAAALNGKGDWNIGKTGYALSAAGVQAIWDALTSALTTVGSIGKRIADNLDVVLSTRGTSTYAGTDTAGTTTLLTRVPGVVPVATDYTAARAAKLDNLDATVSSRGTSTYAGTDTAGTTTLLSRLGSPVGASISADVAGVPAATLAAATATPIASEVKKVNGVAVTGAGTVGSPWGP